MSPSDTWSAPVAIFPHAGANTLPHLVMDADGDGYVADSGPNRPLRVRTVAPDGTLGPVQVLAPASDNARHIDMGITDSGHVTVAFTAGAAREERARVRDAGAGTPAAQIAAGSMVSTLVSFQEASNGYAAALMCLGNQKHCTYAIYTRHGDGGPFTRAGTLPAGIRAPQVAIATDGALVAWVASSSSRSIHAVDIARGGRAGAAFTVVAHPEIDKYLPYTLAVAPGGGAVILWGIDESGGRWSVSYVARAARGTHFGAVTALTTGAHHHDTGELRLVSSRGSILLVTSEAGADQGYEATIRTWTPTGGFSAPRGAASATGDGFEPFAATGGGRTVLAWVGEQGIEATVADGASPFTPPATLSAHNEIPQSGAGPFLAVDGRGSALAVWIDYNATSQVELARLPPLSSPAGSGAALKPR